MLQEFSKMFKECYEAGINWIMASGAKATGINSFTVTLSGSSPHTHTFAANDRPNMASADYQLIVQGETASRITVDESTKAAAGFSTLGGADAEVVHVVCIGRLNGMPEV